MADLPHASAGALRVGRVGGVSRADGLHGRALGLVAPDPQRGLHADRLFVDPHLEVLRRQSRNGLAVVVDHPHVDDHAGDLHPLEERLRLGCAPARREQQSAASAAARFNAASLSRTRSVLVGYLPSGGSTMSDD